MARDLLLGVDIGTQGAKAVLCDPAGHILASGYREHSTTSPQPGWAEHNAENLWWGAFVGLVRAVLHDTGIDANRVAGVGVSAFVPGLLPLDQRNRPLRPAILYTDRRAQAELEALRAQLEAVGLTEVDTGPLDLASPIVQLMWVRNHEPEVYGHTTTILQCGPYIVFRLTGARLIDHAMKRSYAPLYDLAQDYWSAERATLLGLDVKILPDRIAWASEVAGHVTVEAAAETGLAPGTPVAVGTADAFAEMVGAGVVTAGTGAMLYGSFTALLVAGDQPESPWHGYHCLPNLYFSGAGVSTGATLTRWFRDNFGSAELALEQPLGQNAYQLLEQEAASVPPGCEGLVALPDFSGMRSRLDANLARGALVGLTLNHGRGHVYRALLEGVAYELRYQMDQNGGLPPRLMAVGGGARSVLWTQIASDVLDVTQDVLEVTAGAPFGAAYLAGIASGLFGDTGRLIEQWLRIRRTVIPKSDTQTAYTSAYKAFVSVRASMI
jgi:xylulokinase